MQVTIKKHNHDLDEVLSYWKENGVNVEWHLNPFAVGIVAVFHNVERVRVEGNVLTMYLEKGGVLGIICDKDTEIEAGKEDK